MEAPPGFEPGYVGIKTQCLSTWLRGYLRVAKKVFISCKHLFDNDYLSVSPFKHVANSLSEDWGKTVPAGLPL